MTFRFAHSYPTSKAKLMIHDNSKGLKKEINDNKNATDCKHILQVTLRLISTLSRNFQCLRKMVNTNKVIKSAFL